MWADAHAERQEDSMNGIKSKFAVKAALVAAAMFAAPAAVAFVSAPSADAALASTSARCTSPSTAGDAACKPLLLRAEKAHPRAGVALSGHGTGFGQFIVPNPAYDGYMTVNVSGYTLPGTSGTTQGANGVQETTGPAAHAVSNGIAGYCGNYYTVVANVSGSWLLNNVAFDTVNYVYLCYYAWNHWHSPVVSCWGAGTCGYQTTGVVGNYTSQVEPWGYQSVGIWGCCTIQWNLRVWVDRYGNISWQVVH
jgi:hypothetical protein